VLPTISLGPGRADFRGLRFFALANPLVVVCFCLLGYSYGPRYKGTVATLTRPAAGEAAAGPPAFRLLISACSTPSDASYWEDGNRTPPPLLRQRHYIRIEQVSDAIYSPEHF
jgi:hypothetical protein